MKEMTSHRMNVGRTPDPDNSPVDFGNMGKGIAAAPAKSEMGHYADNTSHKQSEKSFLTGYQNDASSLSGNSMILTDNLKDRLTRSVSNQRKSVNARDDASGGANSAYGPASALTGGTDYSALATSGLI